jgi:hypothetical protein
MIHPSYNFSDIDVDDDLTCGDNPATEVTPHMLENFSRRLGVELSKEMCLDFINEILCYIHPSNRTAFIAVVGQLNKNLSL